MQSTSSTSRVVKQFHFVAWPENGAPSSGDGMIDLIDQVVRTQQQTGNKPIVVHCRSVLCVCLHACDRKVGLGGLGKVLNSTSVATPCLIKTVHLWG